MSAAVRFRPVPPARSEMRKTLTSPPLNRRTSSARTGFGVEPCSVKWLMPASSRRLASRSSMEVNWLNSRMRCPPSTAEVTSSVQASSLALPPSQLSAMRCGSQQISRSRISTANTAILSSGLAALSFSRASSTAAR